MENISYKQRDCQVQDKIRNFLTETRVGVLGIGGDEHPYAVPVNFVWHQDTVYFHGMGSGKKVRLLADNPDVCFTVFREDSTVPHSVPCHADTAYMSVMLFGRAEKVSDVSEAVGALQKILDKYLPNVYSQGISSRMVEKHRSSMDGNTVAVYRMTPVHITAKENSDP